jgi:hypothetical protein
LLGTYKDMQKKALEMEHLSPCRGFVRGTWRGGIFTGDSERHPREGLGRGASIFTEAP